MDRSGMESMGTRVGRHMGSFRVRLVAYFLLLSLLPLIATLWAFSGVAARSERALAVATTDFRDRVEAAAAKAESLAQRAGYEQALSGPSRVALSHLFRQEPNAAFYRGGTLVAGLEPSTLADKREAVVEDRAGHRLGRAVVYVPLDMGLLERVHTKSGLQEDDALALVRGGHVIVGQDVGGSLRQLDEHPTEVGFDGTEYRAAGATISPDLGVGLAVLVPQAKIDAAAD